MRKIAQLPQEVAERIAAGEVVERPASVVKELIENSVDAGATDIALCLRKGGKDLIRVQDNGEGIPPDSLPLAVARYATSKIERLDDLWHVATLGFRGEALASIGQVAELTITSRTDEREGATITVKGGAVGAVKPAACLRGTIVEVRDLFFSVPARRKFLKQDSTEFGRAADWVTRIALAAPGVGFTLEHDGKVVWRILPGATLAERMGVFFGPDVAHKLLVVDGGGAIKVKGAVARPEIWRHDRRSINFFVNGRHVRDPMLNQALEEAFRGYLIPGRFPIATLGILIDPERIDVNVHPAKAEIKFANGSEVFQAVVRAVRAALVGIGPRAIETPDVRADDVSDGLLSMAAPQTHAGSAPSAAPLSCGHPARASTRYEIPALDVTPPAPRAGGGSVSTTIGSLPRVLQVAHAYLVRERAEGIEILDQHALHEKILFRTLRERLQGGPLAAQELLFPVPVRLRPEEVAETEEYRQLLQRYGIGVDAAGPDLVMVRAVPALGETDNPERLLREVLQALLSGGNDPAAAIAARLACALAVKAGRVLSAEEAEALLRQAEGVDDLDTCPHGRPTRLVLSFAQLQKHFDRK